MTFFFTYYTKLTGFALCYKIKINKVNVMDTTAIHYLSGIGSLYCLILEHNVENVLFTRPFLFKIFYHLFKFCCQPSCHVSANQEEFNGEDS